MNNNNLIISCFHAKTHRDTLVAGRVVFVWPNRPADVKTKTMQYPWRPAFTPPMHYA